MSLGKEILALLKLELLLELRQKYTVSGIVLYILSTVFIAYLAFQSIIDASTWNALFWIILLFAAVNAIAKSFLRESAGRKFYLYTLSSPRAIILAKIIYNAALVSVLSLICLLCYTLLLGNLIQNLPLFLVALLLGGFGFSSTLTLISAIASQSENNATLMAILSFPIILPLLVTLMSLSSQALVGDDWSQSAQPITILVALNVLVLTLSSILFPYLWRV